MQYCFALYQHPIPLFALDTTVKDLIPLYVLVI